MEQGCDFLDKKKGINSGWLNMLLKIKDVNVPKKRERLKYVTKDRMSNL